MAKQTRRLQENLLLNKYMCNLFGLNDIKDFKKLFTNIGEGIDTDTGLLRFTIVLKTLQNINPKIKTNLDKYDENIQEYLEHINKKRDNEIVLKYYQYISILLTEIYLDLYFENFEEFRNDLLIFSREQSKNNSFQKKLYFGGDLPNKPEFVSLDKLTKDKISLSKLAYWSATSSGKTFMLHINYLQILKYNNQKIDNIILITKNESLTIQHLKEFEESNIKAKRFEMQNTLLDWTSSKDYPIKVIEITKIKDEKTGNGETVPIEAFGENNIVFVDEAHSGLKGNQWKRNRDALKGKGFMFEYSATFGEVANSDDILFDEYQKCIIFDYSYKYFYEDGYGKDYNILNLNNDNYNDEYFVGSILSFYEQKKYFLNYKKEIREFNLQNPLMLFVGSRVGTAENNDILDVIKFLSKFVVEKEEIKKHIENIIDNKSTNLLDKQGNPIFSDKLKYLKNLIKIEGLSVEEVYKDILKIVFNLNNNSQTLSLWNIKKANGEIGLKFGEDFFGVINIGDEKSFLKQVENNNSNDEFSIEDANVENSLFNRLSNKNSTINFLLGSKKFTEGWNNFRVTSMGLLNIGKNEGSQIIQLFGRGVRLRGLNGILKRTNALKNQNLIPLDVKVPKQITTLETLNIFGLKANYMANFKEALEREGIEEYDTISLKIKPTLPNNQNLYIPKPNKEDEELFVDEKIVNKFDKDISKISLDLSAKIETFNSKQKELATFENHFNEEPTNFKKDIIELMDFDKIYSNIIKHKQKKSYYNLFFTKQDLKEILFKTDKYELYSKEDFITLNSFDTIEKIGKLEEFAKQIIISFIDKSYKFEKYDYLKDKLHYDNIRNNENLIQNLIPKEYVFTINADSKELMEDLKEFERNMRIKDDIYENNNINEIPTYNGQKIIETYVMNNIFQSDDAVHLFQPLIYKRKNIDMIKISPNNLVDSEKKFVNNLSKYLEDNKDKINFDKIYLLRNPSSSGISFFDTKNFYPDFILWAIKGEKQVISFIDPKGLQFVAIDDQKILLHKDIKDVQKQLENKEKKNIELHSFILSETKYENLNWRKINKVDKKQLEDMNVLFLEDKEKYLDILFEKIKI